MRARRFTERFVLDPGTHAPAGIPQNDRHEGPERSGSLVNSRLPFPRAERRAKAAALAPRLRTLACRDQPAAGSAGSGVAVHSRARDKVTRLAAVPAVAVLAIGLEGLER